MHSWLWRSVLLACAVSGAGLATAGPRAAGTPPSASYRVTDLGMLPGCDVTYATGVNEAGWVSGYAYTHVPPGHGDELLSRPFLWRAGKLLELPKLGGEFGQACAINAHGDLAGYAEKKDYSDRPVIWRRSEGFRATPLAELPGRVRCLQDDGSAGGWVYQEDQMRAAVWIKGSLRLVGDPQDAESECYALNRRGDAVGAYVPQGQPTQSMMWRGASRPVLWRGGKQRELPSLLERIPAEPRLLHTCGVCEALNDAGLAAGWTDGPNGRQACLWKEGKLELLPALGRGAEAHAINRSGLVVGEATDPAAQPRAQRVACRWLRGKLEDLNRLIPAGSGWTLTVASAVSNNGLIVGYGSYHRFPSDYWRAFLLTPAAR